jgi:hypothetical protein
MCTTSWSLLIADGLSYYKLTSIVSTLFGEYRVSVTLNSNCWSSLISSTCGVGLGKEFWSQLNLYGNRGSRENFQEPKSKDCLIEQTLVSCTQILQKSKFSKQINQVRSTTVVWIMCQIWEAILFADWALFWIDGYIVLISCEDTGMRCNDGSEK